MDTLREVAFLAMRQSYYTPRGYANLFLYKRAWFDAGAGGTPYLSLWSSAEFLEKLTHSAVGHDSHMTGFDGKKLAIIRAFFQPFVVAGRR